MPEEKPEIIICLNVNEGERLKQGLEKCFKHTQLFSADELEGLEYAYDKLMGLS